jgi:hypothetical protein
MKKTKLVIMNECFNAEITGSIFLPGSKFQSLDE